MLVRLKDKITIGMVMDFMSTNDLNYEVIRESIQPETNAIIYKELQCTCSGCPSIYEFINIHNNHKLYFRLRYGIWKLVDETDEKILASGTTEEFDGICDFNDACSLIAKENILLINQDDVTEIELD